MGRRKKRTCVKCGAPHLDPEGGLCVPCGQAGAYTVQPSSLTAHGSTQCADCSTLLSLLDRVDGWLRIVPREDGEYSLKWRFTSGVWRGHYVFWQSGKCGTLQQAFRGLSLKLAEVDAGHLRPSVDDLAFSK